MSQNRLQSWQHKSAKSLVTLSLLYTFVYVYPIYAYPVSTSVVKNFHIAEYTIWGFFIVDYMIQFQLSTSKKSFLKSEWLSLLFAIVPFFRPIRAIRGVIFLRQASTRPKESMLLSIPWILAAIGILMTLILSASILNVERNVPGSSIHTVGDALWWSLLTLTGMGGNDSPVTGEGKLYAATLIVFGIGLLASLTGYIASWMLKQIYALSANDE